jgi:3-dehydroquinate synthase
MQKIIVDLGKRSYPVCIGASVADIGTLMRGRPLTRRALVVTNPTVKKHYFAALARSLQREGFAVAACVLPDGEKYKTLDSINKIYRAALRARLDRRSPIIALGGGVIGDMAGFAAATYLRGVPFVQVPTTLLAMVDASVGGKTGVDLKEGKNLVGAFYQPDLVLIAPSTLATLPARQLRNGMAEVIKYGVIRDRALFAFLEKRLAAGRGRLPSRDYEAVIARCCRIKAAVVSADEREEKGVREILNFGHTFGHAIETLTGYRKYCHGEAVALGMHLAGRLAGTLGMFTESARLDRLLAAAGLPAVYKEKLSARQVLAAMRSDKKAHAGIPRFVLPTAIGKVTVREVPAAKVAQVLKRNGVH